LSPDGTSLAADIGPVLSGTRMVVFDLATVERTALRLEFQDLRSAAPVAAARYARTTHVDALVPGNGRQ